MTFVVQPSLLEILQSATALYDTWNGRSLRDFLPQDTLTFIADPQFFSVLEMMSQEIRELRGAPLLPKGCLQSLIEWLQERDYGFVFSLDDLGDQAILLRQKLLTALMTDLLTERFLQKKRLVSAMVVARLPKNSPSQALVYAAADRILGTPTATQDLNSVVRESVMKALNTARKPQYTDVYNVPALDQETRATLDQWVTLFNQEYKDRHALLLKRLDVSLHAFLWSGKMSDEDNRQAVYTLLQASLKWRAVSDLPDVHLWDIVSHASEALKNQSARGEKLTVPCALRRITIGEVAGRGGIPEGYSADHVRREIMNANRMLKRGNPGSATRDYYARDRRERGHQSRPRRYGGARGSCHRGNGQRQP